MYMWKMEKKKKKKTMKKDNKCHWHPTNQEEWGFFSVSEFPLATSKLLAVPPGSA